VRDEGRCIVTSNEIDSVAENRVAPGMPGGASSAAGDHVDPLRRARGWLALGGLLAGLAAFGAGEAVYKLIPAELVKTRTMGQIVIGPSAKTSAVADVRNGALAFGLLGACVGGFLGAAGGLARRSAPAILGASVLGVILGLATGALVSFGLLPFFLDTQPYHPEYEMILSLIMHGAVWGLTGAAAGLAFAVGLGERRLLLRAIAAAFVGAVLGAIIFELAGAAIFPLASTGQPISTTWPSRLLARILVTVTSVAVVSMSLSGPFPTSSPPSREVSPPTPS
jgi:hypothetical protein